VCRRFEGAVQFLLRNVWALWSLLALSDCLFFLWYRSGANTVRSRRHPALSFVPLPLFLPPSSLVARDASWNAVFIADFNEGEPTSRPDVDSACVLCDVALSFLRSQEELENALPFRFLFFFFSTLPLHHNTNTLISLFPPTRSTPLYHCFS